MGRLKGYVLSEETKLKMKESNKTKIKVRCDQTNEYFDSIKEASIKMGIDIGNLSRHLRGFRKTVSGYTFTAVDQ